MTRVGIAGATGFIGSYLLEYLARHTEYELRGLTRTLRAELPGLGRRVDWRQGDLTSPRDCTAFADGLDVIVHLAGVHSPLTSNVHLPSDAVANTLPLLTLLQAVRDAGTQPHVVFASSGGAIYKSSPPAQPRSELDPVEPLSSYGIQKLVGEHYLRMAAEQGWLTAVALRIGNPYGVLLPRERLQGLIGTAVSQLLAGEAIRLFGSLGNVRDYVHLEDVCRMFELVLVRRRPFTIYNVGSGRGYSVSDILALLEECSDRRLVTEHAAVTGDPDALPSWIILDIAKARSELGWSPTIPLKRGLTRLLDNALARR